MTEWELPLRLAHKASYLMAMQELSGVCFDVSHGMAGNVFGLGEVDEPELK